MAETIHGIDLEVVRRGAGAPVVLLHGFQQIDPAPASWRPSTTGQDHRPVASRLWTVRPAQDFETIYDLVNLYAAFLDALPFDKVTLVGFSFGGWLAAELAARSCHKIARLILVDSVGIKISDRETADILDIFNTHPDEVRRRTWHDPANGPDFDAMTDEALIMRHRNWESLSLYAWHPYMHNPRLAFWLPRSACRLRLSGARPTGSSRQPMGRRSPG